MGYCRASAIRLLEQELLSGEHKNESDAVNAVINKSPLRLDSREKLELIHIAREQMRNQMIVQYFV